MISRLQEHDSASDNDKPYEMWRQRLDKTPSGAPRHPAALELLKLYCGPEEADFLSRMPAKFASLTQLSRLYKMDLAQIEHALQTLTDKFLVAYLDCGRGVRLYAPMEITPGFWEFTFMRIRDDRPVAEITKLFEEYWDTLLPEALGQGKPTQDFRVMVREESLGEKFTEILDYERTSSIIQGARRISVTTCACSSMKMQRKKPMCDRPTETCMAFDAAADAVIGAGQGREISKAEAMSIVDECKAHGMVQCGDNVKAEPWYLCNCCSCCCTMLEAMRNYDLETTVVTAGFIAEADSEKCENCGDCIDSCPADCIEEGASAVEVDQSRCLGCGVCVDKCPSSAMKLTRRQRRIYTPNDINEKVLAMALERGKLADQIFYDPNRLSHRSLCTLINALLKMPPVKQALAAQAFKSRFLKFGAKLVAKDFDKTVRKERQRLTRQNPNP